MSGGGGGGEKTEKPTPKKLADARKEGQIGKTPDLGAWAMVLGATFVLPMVISGTGSAATDLLMQVGGVIQDPDPAKTTHLLGTGLKAGAFALAPLAAVTVLVAIAGAAVQGGLHPATKLLKPQLKRLNPWPGLKRNFGPHGAWEALKTTIKTAALGVVLYAVIQTLTPALLTAGAMPLGSTVASAANAALTLIRLACLTGLIMAAADYVMVKRRSNKQLKMSHHEIKQEHKQSEGDPQLKGAIRSRQLAMSRNRMMTDVATADVVMVNPTHVAVALRYDPAKGAPRVVAKGAGPIAAKIREIADEKRVPMVSDIPLARALYKSCEVGQEVPPEMFTAVATVLAFVMALKSKGSAAGMHRVPQRPVIAF
ncbi:MAG: flhB [Cryptosporangiaceae bacterium]|jgi:flagellar biosynthetic protein FlhB|nr:flhB [Cryptosporangiaceae bacterium]